MAPKSSKVEATSSVAAAAVEVSAVASVTEQIVSVLAGQLLLNYPLNKARLEQEIGDKVAAKRPIDMLLPAFPCKSINTDKVLGLLPDMAEYLALRKMARAIRDIEGVYQGGANLTIFSDYHTFARYISVGKGAYQQYHQGLEDMIDHLGAKDIIRIVNFSTHQEFQSDMRDDYEYQTVLEELYGDPNYASSLDAKIDHDEDTLTRYRGMIKFMEQDQEPLIRKLSNRSKARAVSHMAKGMMVSGQALDSFLKTNYPGVLRLSIHCYDKEGPKSSISLLEDNTIKTPWHNTVMYDAGTGRYVTDKRTTLTSCEANKVVIGVMFEDQRWMLLQLEASSQAVAKKMRFIQARLQKEAFGLFLEAPEGLLNIADINKDDMTNLIKEFGFVVFRGFQRSTDVQQLEAWYSTRGSLIPWSFGHTKVVKSNPTEPGFVTSTEGLPLHFDLMMPPAYMGIDQSKHSYVDFIPREFLLYCKKAPGRGQGVSLMVDTTLAALMLSGGRKEAFRQTKLSFYTVMTHFGGRHYDYSLVHRCPWTGHDTLRWSEVWDERSHPGTSQSQHYKVAESPLKVSAGKLEQQLCKVLKDGRAMAHLDFADGDYVLINNYTTVHGRTAFANPERELWRVQQAPPSNNVPWEDPAVAERILALQEEEKAPVETK